MTQTVTSRYRLQLICFTSGHGGHVYMFIVHEGWRMRMKSGKQVGWHSSLRICFSPISLNLMMTECFQALEEQILQNVDYTWNWKSLFRFCIRNLKMDKRKNSSVPFYSNIITDEEIIYEVRLMQWFTTNWRKGFYK